MSSELTPASGSINSFAEARGLEPEAASTLAEYSGALSQRRAETADNFGVTLDELHEGHPSAIIMNWWKKHWQQEMEAVERL